MRKLVISQNITIDGVIEATDDWFTQAGVDPELDTVLAAQRDASDGFLVPSRRLHLLESQVLTSGVVLMRYGVGYRPIRTELAEYWMRSCKMLNATLS